MLNEILWLSKGLVIFIDNGKEKYFRNIIRAAINRPNDRNSIELKLTKSLKHTKTLEVFLNECNAINNIDKADILNVMLPPLSDILVYQPVSIIFHFLNTLRKNDNVSNIFLWVAPHLLMHSHVDFIMTSLKYMADLTVYFESKRDLSVILRKPGGGISKTCYEYTRDKDSISLQSKILTETLNKGTVERSFLADKLAARTFRIELDEEEMLTRNALALPFEKKDTRDKIIYVPSSDDYDGEDPDEDLDV